MQWSYNDLIFTLIVALFFVACSKDDENNSAKGLVSFKTGPSFARNAITFTPQVQFGGNGKAINIEYIILDGNSQIESGKAYADINEDGMKLWFQSGPVQVAIAGSQYSGKTLVVYLDPENKVTSLEYTSDTYVDAYKKESVIIP